MERIQFNTGRYYSAHGQRIIAVKYMGTIYFNDIDRNITGMFSAPNDDFGTVDLSPVTVMSRYDNQGYDCITGADPAIYSALVWK